MAEPEAITSSLIRIKINGTEISQEMMNDLEDLLIDQNAHLPAMFRIRFHDTDFNLIDNKAFGLTKEVEIIGLREDNSSFPLIKGEVTALEPQFSEGMLSYLVIHGYDKSHRLFRETKSRSFVNKKDSDLAGEIGRGAGLSVQAETTSTVYEHIFQHNQSDMAFLKQRAWRIGYECYVEDGKLYFQKPKMNGGASATLTWGDNLINFMPRMSLADQVDEVVVRGWDPSAQKAIVGRASKGQLYPKNGEGKDGAGWAGSFGAGKVIMVDVPVVSQAEANKIAEARLNELSGMFIEAEGEAFRRPDIRAGQLVELKNVGNRFSGTYLITHVTHRFSGDGFKSVFHVRGLRSGLLQEQFQTQAPLGRWPSVVLAVVTNTEDETSSGAVKVKFPWMSDDAESTWARVMGLGAGNNAGLNLIPEVGDEVVVAFELGDFDRPIVIGGLWSDKNKIPDVVADAGKGKRPTTRTWRSRKGHHITMIDEEKIEIVTKGGHKVILDDKGKKLSVESSGGHSVVMDDNARSVTVKSKGSLTMESELAMKIKSKATLDIEATGPVSVKGVVVKLN